MDGVLQTDGTVTRNYTTRRVCVSRKDRCISETEFEERRKQNEFEVDCMLQWVFVELAAQGNITSPSKWLLHVSLHGSCRPVPKQQFGILEG